MLLNRKGSEYLLVLLDLWVVFDTIQHCILLGFLSGMGLGSTVVSFRMPRSQKCPRAHLYYENQSASCNYPLRVLPRLQWHTFWLLTILIAPSTLHGAVSEDASEIATGAKCCSKTVDWLATGIMWHPCYDTWSQFFSGPYSKFWVWLFERSYLLAPHKH